MPIILTAALLAVFAALGLGAMGLVGVRMWVKGRSGQDIKELADQVRQELREEVRNEISLALDAQGAEIEELHERLDYAERLLSQARLPKPIEQREATPV